MRWQRLKRVARSGDVLVCLGACVVLAHSVGLGKLPSAQGADPALVEVSRPAANLGTGVSAPRANEALPVRDASRLTVELAAARLEALSQSPPSSRTWKNTLGMEFVHIEPGEFTMGSSAAQVEQLLKLFPDAKREEFSAEQPAHVVRITKGYELGKHKVTIGQFRTFVASTNYQAEAEREAMGARSKAWFPQSDDHPVVNVSWHDAHAFCDWLTKKENNGVSYRLPTEAEWEYACRAGSATLFTNGDDPEKLALIGNVADASARRKYPDWTWTIKADDGHVYTSPVGSFAPNSWGLFDMIGNVWEWCEDSYEVDYYKSLSSPSDDPRGPSLGSFRVIRGSNWFIHPRRCRPADRGGFAPGFRCSFLGFRLAAVRS
jgi:formylglycine-generating enzyme required for sulfatase activity